MCIRDRRLIAAKGPVPSKSLPVWADMKKITAAHRATITQESMRWAPVSYTHLDVYKRQVETGPGEPDDPAADPSEPGDKNYHGSITTTWGEPSEDNPHPGRVTLKVETPSTGKISVTDASGNVFTADFLKDCLLYTSRLQRVDHLIIGAQTHHSHLAVVEQPRRNEDCADPFLALLFGPVNGNAGSGNNDPPDNRHHNIEGVVHEIELQRMPNPEEGNGSQQKHSGYDPVALSHTT